MSSTIIEKIMDLPAEYAGNIFGQFDAHMKLLERTLRVTLVFRDGVLKIVGPQAAALKAESVIRELLELAKRGNTITMQNVTYALSLTVDEREGALTEIDRDLICHTINGRPIKPKTLGQKKYVDEIRSKMIVFGVGPAGTGKTYLAIAMAVTAFRNDEVSRIILTRPAIEAGEKLGFLPGDLQSKVDPYLRPLYDALFEMLGFEKVEKLIERNVIEVAPLAYMRGRTLNDAFIILDESQNTTIEQMKMFLTRIGFNSKAVITGDVTQIDLPRNTKSGLRHAIEVLADVEEISFNFFHSEDVVRHPVVARIVNAYEAWEEAEQKRKAALAAERKREEQEQK